MRAILILRQRRIECTHTRAARGKARQSDRRHMRSSCTIGAFLIARIPFSQRGPYASGIDDTVYIATLGHSEQRSEKHRRHDGKPVAVPGRRGAGRSSRPRHHDRGVARDATAAAGAADPVGAAAQVAAARGDHVLPLRHEHLHGLGVGHGDGGPVPVPPRGAQRHPVDGRGARGGGLARHPRRQAPRRVLPLAVPVHGPLRARQPLARRPRRRGQGVRGRRPCARRRRRPVPLAVGPARRAVRPGGRVQRVLRGPAPRAPHRVRERVGDLVRRRQGQERDQHDVPLPGVVPDGEAAAALHQHLLRRWARRPVGRRREGLRRNHLLVRRQPLHDHHRRSRHREVPERGRPTGARLGAAGVRRVDPDGLVLAQERDGQAAEPAVGDLLQLRGPELRAPAERAAQLHGPGGGRRHRAAARVRGRRGHHLRHGPRRGQRGQCQQRARRRVRGAERAGRPRRHVLGADDGRRRAPERGVLDRAAAAGAGRAGAVQRGADPGARGAGAARGAARGVRGRRARGQRHDGGAQAAAPAALRRRGHDGEGLDHGAAWPAAAVGGGPPLRPLRRGGHDVTWRRGERGAQRGLEYFDSDCFGGVMVVRGQSASSQPQATEPRRATRATSTTTHQRRTGEKAAPLCLSVALDSRDGNPEGRNRIKSGIAIPFGWDSWMVFFLLQIIVGCLFRSAKEKGTIVLFFVP